MEAPEGYWVTDADPTLISRDPDAAIRDVVWCTPDGAVANAAQQGASPVGGCPSDPFAVTAVYAFMPNIRPDAQATIDLVLDTEDAGCNDIWTNTFGARVANIMLPVRSNDVSIMTSCEPDIAIEKYDTEGDESLSVALASGGSYSVADAIATDADTVGEAADLSTTDGATDIAFTVVNNGTEPLVDVVVGDSVTTGEATVEAMSCTFPGEPDPTPG